MRKIKEKNINEIKMREKFEGKKNRRKFYFSSSAHSKKYFSFNIPRSLISFIYSSRSL